MNKKTKKMFPRRSNMRSSLTKKTRGVSKKFRTKNTHYKRTLEEQMKDNPWMNEIITKISKGEKLNTYDKYLYELMKDQPQKPGYLSKLIEEKSKTRKKL